MDIKTFRENTEVIVTDELIKSVIDAFLNSNMPFYNESLSLMNCVEMDKTNSGKISSTDEDSFINELMLNNLFSKYNGKEAYLSLSEEERLNAGRDERKNIEEFIQKHPTLVFGSKGLLDEKGFAHLSHEFIIKVSPEDFISVLNELYKNIKDKNLDRLRIITPTLQFVEAGSNAPIRLRCSSKDLEATLNLLDNISEETKRKTKTVLPIYDITSSWYGYQQHYSNYKSSTATFCSAVHDAMVETLQEYLGQESFKMSDGESFSAYYDKASNKYVAMRDIIKKTLEQNQDFIDTAVETTKKRFPDWNVIMVDCLKLPLVENELDNIYGPIVQEESNEPEEIVSGELEPESISVVNATSLEDIAFPDIEPISEIVGETQETVSDDTPINENKGTLEKRDEEKYLDSLLAGVTDDPAVLNTSELIEEVAASEDLVLPDDFTPSAEEDDELKELEAGIDQVISSIQAAEELENESSTTVERKIDVDALNETETHEFMNDKQVLIPDLSDVAYSGDDLRDALTTGGYYTDFEYIKALAEHFNISNYQGDPIHDKIILDNLRHLDRFDKKGSKIEEQVTAPTSPDALTKDEIKVLLDESKHKIDVDPSVLEEVKAEITEDDIVVPDLSSVPYSGDDLREALRMGGFAYYSDEYHLKSLAKHFGIENYVGSEAQDLMILDKLLHRDPREVSTKDKYKGFVSNLDVLDRKVKGEDFTILDYFEKYNLLNYVQPDSEVLMHNQKKSISGSEFVSKYFIFYLINRGADDINEILESYIDVDETKHPVPTLRV
ncbi:MAG: hypothetical protein J1F35_03975 [Erysipelotrichales bacterium]|nr:hypothetical protein [Erysipelotrichales bacterium]